LEYCHAVWYGKLEWFGYTTVKKIEDKKLKICLFLLTECTNVTDGRTDRRTYRHRMTAKAALAQHRAAKIFYPMIIFLIRRVALVALIL